MNIAIIDNQKELLNIIEIKLNKLQIYNFEIYSYTNIKDLDESFILFDLILLDLDIPNIDGIMYSKNNKDKNIVFMSWQKRKTEETFESNVYGYIEKIDLNSKNNKILESVIQDIIKTKFIIFKIDSITKYFDLDQIVYLQYIGGRTIGFVYKKHHFIMKTCILKDIKERLGKQFIYIDRNTLINIVKIKDVVGNKVIIEGIPQLFDISKRRVHIVKEVYIKNI